MYDDNSYTIDEHEAAALIERYAKQHARQAAADAVRHLALLTAAADNVSQAKKKGRTPERVAEYIARMTGVLEQIESEQLRKDPTP